MMTQADVNTFEGIEQDKAINNIVKVNHAGEFGAIRIYRGQRLVSQFLYPALVPKLNEFAGHEEDHFRIFGYFVRARGVRTCSVFFVWGVGGWILGVLTALLGREGMMVCTDAVESTVDRHLERQISFLKRIDPELCGAIEKIRVEEQSHGHYARMQMSSSSLPWRTLHHLISFGTEAVIWLSMRL